MTSIDPKLAALSVRAVGPCSHREKGMRALRRDCGEGNYYSLKAQHAKAVLYFKRALKLNRKFLAAWTLMGHEFVEMKNTGAAIEAYREAVGKCSTNFPSTPRSLIGSFGIAGPGTRYQCPGLSGMVWPRPDVRTSEHVSLRSLLLSQGRDPQVKTASPRRRSPL